MKIRSLASGLIVACLASVGCISWKPSWREAGLDQPKNAAVEALLDAQALSAVADDGDKVREAIAAYERVLEINPGQIEALASIADHSILLATAYTQRKKDKTTLFDRALKHAELAMYTNEEFKTLVAQGEKPWEASRVLTARELDAMQAWVTAVLYYFKEGMSGPARLFNISWIRNLEPVLTRMDEIDDGWVPGATALNWGFYYFVLPKSLGGNRELSGEKFDEAIDLAEDRMFAHWGKAKFYSVVTKNKDEFRRELEWVAAQDPAEFVDPPHWKAHFQVDARELLKDVDGYFRRKP